MSELVQELVTQLKELKINCGDLRGEDGEYLDVQVDEALSLAIELEEEIFRVFSL